MFVLHTGAETASVEICVEDDPSIVFYAGI